MECRAYQRESVFQANGWSSGLLVLCWIFLGLLSLAWFSNHAHAEDIAWSLPQEIPSPVVANSSEMGSIEMGSDIQADLESLQHQIDLLKSVQSQPLVCCPPEKQDPKFPTVRLTGFFQADAVWFDQTEANKFAVGNGVIADGDAQDGADFRRARLAAMGQAWDNVSYMLEMDFAFPGRPSFMDVWLDIDDAIGSNNFRAGQFRQPFGMDGLTSVKELTFLERALPFAFLPFRQIGVMTYGASKDETLTYALSGFRFPTDFFGGNVGDAGGYGMASRVTSLLCYDSASNRAIHLGGAYCFINPSNDIVAYRNQPEVFVGETGGGAAIITGVPPIVPPFVDTGLIPTDNVNLFNAEFAFTSGSLHGQSEAYFARVDQRGGPSLYFPGAYAQLGYILTGESRPYNTKNAVLGRIKPRHSVGKEGGIGAWEVAGRWSYIDLNDENIQGRRLNNLTFGLNWYLNPYTKFQFNYIHAMLNSPLNGDSTANIYALRAQVDF